ncbi:MAG: hypothetical protein JM58_14125 [Peptococcaceae bacterium BICA1-8]|nr:MAG: hypothetical protein JM58_14125 [Peptococcaceae bacterium BICA1-8]
MQQNKYQIKLENYEGPLDLLLHLIEKNEIDIYDIPIAKITDQYISYIRVIEQLDLDWASEFLVLAATLLAIKAKMLLPKPIKLLEEVEDPREELVARLLEYKKFKEAAGLLKDKENEMHKVFLRKQDEEEVVNKFGPSNPVENISIYDLLQAFKIILEKTYNIEPVYEIEKEKISIQQCMIIILAKLESNSKLLFTDLFPIGTSQTRVIVTFLALLELIKKNRIGFRQKSLFSRIFIYLKEDNLE